MTLLTILTKQQKQTNVNKLTIGLHLMNKAQLIEKIALEAEISKASAERALNAFISNVSDELSSGGEISLVGFGTFKVADRAARTGRNPQTGETLQIAASKNPTFKAGKVLKEAVNA